MSTNRRNSYAGIVRILDCVIFCSKRHVAPNASALLSCLMSYAACCTQKRFCKHVPQNAGVLSHVFDNYALFVICQQDRSKLRSSGTQWFLRTSQAETATHYLPEKVVVRSLLLRQAVVSAYKPTAQTHHSPLHARPRPSSACSRAVCMKFQSI